MSMHSPGTWSVVDRMSCGEGWAVVSDHDFPGRPPTVHRRFMAQIIGSIEDARLISAAPEMLEHGQFLLDRIDELDFADMPEEFMRDWMGHVKPAMSRLRAILAKARGTT